MQVQDIKEVLPMVGFDYSSPGGHWQETCPACRRAGVTIAQTGRVGGFG